jgi:UDP-N-acetylglucosamine 4,6-dehydratase/5-epimerase
MDMRELTDFYADSVVLVTGASGTIGSGIVERLSRFEASAIRILDNNETGLFDLERKLRSRKTRIFLGDIRDKERLARAFEGVDVIFHCAALKHVLLCELNAFEAAKTNIFGTQNVIEAALENDVGGVIFISTDKAVNPFNVMGATKLVGERLMLAANQNKGAHRTKFSCARFGNVLNSRGSVLPIFRDQIARGGPVTVTHREMTRFVMTMADAVDLIVTAGATSDGGEIYVPKLKSLNVIDLAEAMVELLALENGYHPSDIKIIETGKQAGEKMVEELMTDDEAEYACDEGAYFVVSLGNKAGHQDQGSRYGSSEVQKLSKNEISQLLKKVYSE